MKTDMGCLETLPQEELTELEALPFERQRTLIRAGYVDFVSRHVILFRGDRTCVVAPFDLFNTGGTLKPDFDKIGFTDYGNTVKFGEFEASSDFILYELDPIYKAEHENQMLGHLFNKVNLFPRSENI